MNKDIKDLVDIHAESGVISTLIRHPNFIAHSGFLMPEYFYNSDNRCVYTAIREMFKSGIETIDAFNIQTFINADPQLKKTFTMYNISSLQEYVDISYDTARNTQEEYKGLAQRVASLAFKRDLHRELMAADNQCFTDKTAAEVVQTTSKCLADVKKKYISTNNSIKTIGEVADSLMEEIEKRRTPDGIYGIPSKFSAVNEYFTYEPTELVLVSGRMKKGKSALMLNESVHKLQIGKPVLYIDTEMSDRLFYERMLANVSGVSIRSIKTGNLSPEEDDAVYQANCWIKQQKFVHIYDPAMDDYTLYETCSLLKNQIGIEFVVYDYIKSNALDSSAQYNDLGARCDFLKNNIAGELNLAVLAGAQLNRQNQIADSDKLERYCSVSVKWQDKTPQEIDTDGEDCGNYKLTVTLNRLGDQMLYEDYIDMNFDGSKMRITQAKQHDTGGPF